MLGLNIAQAEEVQFSHIPEDHSSAQNQIRQHQKDVGPALARQASHNPEDNRGDGVFIEAFDQAYAGGKKGGNNDAGEYQSRNLDAPIHAPQDVYQIQGR